MALLLTTALMQHGVMTNLIMPATGFYVYTDNQPPAPAAFYCAAWTVTNLNGTALNRGTKAPSFRLPPLRRRVAPTAANTPSDRLIPLAGNNAGQNCGFKPVAHFGTSE
jgi:hypothetical protein